MKPSFLLAVIAFCFFLGAGIITVFTGDSSKVIQADKENLDNQNLIYKDVDFDVIWSTTDANLANPYKVIVHNDKLYVQDYDGEKPIPIFNDNGAFMYYISEWGNGPGELNVGYKLLGFLNSDFIIYDDQTKRLLSFNVESGDVISERVSDLNNPLFVDKMIIDRANIPYPAFAFGLDLNKNLTTIQDTVILGDYQSISEIRTAKKNHLLKQGPWAADNQGNIFFAFHDATLILGFSKRGKEIFKTALPYGKDELPDFIQHPVTNAPLSSPNRDEYPKHYIGLSVDKKFIYGLYSGFQVKTRQDLLQVDKLNEGKTLNIFNKQTSDYLFSVKLPYSFRDITVTDDAIYALTVNPDVKIIKFHKPKIFN